MKSPSLFAAPRVRDWIDLSTFGRVIIRTGKVELGQGVLTALVQAAAQRLGLSADRIEIVSGITGATPNEGYTAGSLSIPHSATALEAACDTCVSQFRAHVAATAGAALETITLKDGEFEGPGLAEGVSLWSVAEKIGLDFEVSDAGPPALSNSGPTSLPRIDLARKIAGSGMIQDIRTDDMLHARVLRPPRLGAMPVTESIPQAERAEMVVEGGFVALVGDDPIALARRAERLAAKIEWTGGTEITPAMLRPDALRDLPHEVVELGQEAPDDTGQETVTALYQRPYLMHGSIGCVTALARNSGGKLSVISQTQGPYQLRDALAAMLGMTPEDVTVTHSAGAGCYGHNGADDVAADAALVARHFPERTVRVSWSRAEEFSSAPLATAGEVSVSARLHSDGTPASLRLDIVSGTHARRPGTAPSGTLLAELHRDGTATLSDPIELPEMHGFGGLRNAISPYSVPAQHARFNIVNMPGIRTSAMRGLGTHLNVFAIESFIDELAARAESDPLDYRLSLLDDPRARAVLERVAKAAGWRDRPTDGESGWGIAYSRYKNRAAYVAMVARVTVDEQVHVDKLWCCADAGRVVNMDGLRNQIEGGIVQSASWALFEEVRLTPEGRLPETWEDYPILRFPDLPEIVLDVVDSADPVPLGAGEVAVGPATAVIANAVSDALGQRLRSLPFSRERLMAELLAS